MKSYPIIFQDFSIAGIKREYKRQDYVNREPIPPEVDKHGIDKVFRSQIGCKTETRRLTGLKEINVSPAEWVLEGINDCVYTFHSIEDSGSGSSAYYKHIKRPYGVPGDELWVRETFAYNDEIDTPYLYKQAFNDEYSDVDYKQRMKKEWKSPLFMPREASRITLINDGVTIERLHDITEEGAMRDGAYAIKDLGSSARVLFQGRWINLHGEESWNINPWVWVIKFKVKEIKQ